MDDPKHNNAPLDERSPESDVATPAKRFRITFPKPVIALSALAGVLFLTLLIGSYYHFSASSGSDKALQTAQEKIKQQDQLLVDTQAQQEALSKQMHALRYFAVGSAEAVVTETIARAAQQNPPPDENSNEIRSATITATDRSAKPLRECLGKLNALEKH